MARKSNAHRSPSSDLPDLGGMETLFRISRRHPSRLVRTFAFICAWGALLVFAIPIALLIVFGVRSSEAVYRAFAIVLVIGLATWCFQYTRKLVALSS